MIRVLKTMLLWLLIAALPAQGLAAVITMPCGSGHHEAMPTAHLDHTHASGPALRHDGHAMHAHADDSAVGDAAQTAHPHEHKGACAACWAGAAAPPSASGWSPVLMRARIVFIAPSDLIAGFIPSGLERPPRPVSA